MFPKPKAGDYSPYIATYFTYLEGIETLDALRENKQKIARLFQKLTPEQQAEMLDAKPGVFMPAAGAWGVRGATHVQLNVTSQATPSPTLSL